MATISLDGVRKSFGKTEVIHGVDIDIDDGEFIVIVGPSGCGKSTLLRMVAGLETVTAGEVRIDALQAKINEMIANNQVLSEFGSQIRMEQTPDGLQVKTGDSL